MKSKDLKWESKVKENLNFLSKAKQETTKSPSSQLSTAQMKSIPVFQTKCSLRAETIWRLKKCQVSKESQNKLKTQKLTKKTTVQAPYQVLPNQNSECKKKKTHSLKIFKNNKNPKVCQKLSAKQETNQLPRMILKNLKVNRLLPNY